MINECKGKRGVCGDRLLFNLFYIYLISDNNEKLLNHFMFILYICNVADLCQKY